MPFSVLVIDDDEALCKALVEELSESGFDAGYRCSATEGLDVLIKKPTDFILLDLMMPVHDGFYVLKSVKELGIRSKIIVLTAFADIKSAVEAAKSGAHDFISKPYDFEELLITINKVLSEDSSHED